MQKDVLPLVETRRDYWQLSERFLQNQGMRACLFTSMAVTLLALAIPVQAQDAQALRARHAALSAQLADNPFGRPLYVESSEKDGEHKGAIYAVIEQPFKRVGPALRRAAQWCDVLILQANVKNCVAAANGGGERLSLFVGRKSADSPERAYRVDFGYDVPAAGADYLHVALNAPEGPFGTTDYRIRLEAAPLDQNRSFLHLAYSYKLRSAARMAMNVYLASTGRDKVGFSVVGRTPDGRPVHVGGVRGVVERNTMRYYLGVEAYLGTLDAPATERVEKRLRAFYAGLERYPRQLHELELDEYLEIKRRDASRVLQQPTRS
jgi:hypothetical protein